MASGDRGRAAERAAWNQRIVGKGSRRHGSERAEAGRKPGEWVRSAGRCWRVGILAGLATGPAALGAPLAAQDQDEVVPIVPAGVPLVVLPVQSAQPTRSGAWPGGAPSRHAVLETLTAELAFAFGELRETDRWVMPDRVVERAARNPLLGIDPTRLSYHGLLRPPKQGEEVGEPLHGQLRKLAALFGSRLVLLPLSVRFEVDPDAVGSESVEPVGEADPGVDSPRAASSLGRAVLLMALVDVRRSAVLWHGTMESDPGEPTSPALLATLAYRVARQLSPS